MMNSDFLNTINYSASNEDENSELIALQGLTRPDILCITASGSRPLSLLLLDPQIVTAIDFNITQNYLLELKMLAIKNFDYPNFLKFIGAKDCTKIQRKTMYHEI